MRNVKLNHPELYNSEEENKFYTFLLSLGYTVDRQFIVGGHYFDFKINNFLIEYNGSVYHRVKYENLSNSECKEPPGSSKDSVYHRRLRDIAIENGYCLIQIWDYLWVTERSFVEDLLYRHLSGTANYKDYLIDGLLDNDYGFIVNGEQINPIGQWISTGHPQQIVDESYTKGRVLVYNSGFTRIRETSEK